MSLSFTEARKLMHPCRCGNNRTVLVNLTALRDKPLFAVWCRNCGRTYASKNPLRAIALWNEVN